MKKRGILRLFIMLVVMSVVLPACGSPDTETTVERTKRSGRDGKDKDSKDADSGDERISAKGKGERLDLHPQKTDRGSGDTSTSDTTDTGKRKVTDKDIKTTPSDTSGITYDKYKDPSGYFTMDIPKGWKVSTGGDAIHYYIAVYDPKNPDRRIYVQMLAEGFASDYANEYYKTWFGYDPGYLVIPDATVSGFFESFAGNSELDPHAVYYGFSFIDDLGKLDSGAGIIQGTAYTDSGNKIEMIGTALVQTIADTSGLGLDVVYANGVCILAAGESEFTDWAPILDKSAGTLSFSDTFWKQRNREWANVIQTTQYVSQKWNGVSDGIMSSWEKRTNSHDIMRQRESDAELGYDRVVDIETGKIYRVDTGLMDDYSGSRYELLESGSSLYNEPVDGYITIR